MGSKKNNQQEVEKSKTKKSSFIMLINKVVKNTYI